MKSVAIITLRQNKRRIVAAGLIAMWIAALFGFDPGAAASAAENILEPASVYVEATGTLPGVEDTKLRTFLTSQMNAAQIRRWHFEPAPDEAKPEDRVVWTFTLGPQASGAVRTFGFSRAQMQRLMGSSRRMVTIEARLFRHGAYQTMVSGQASSGPDHPDPELVEKLTELTRELISASEVSGSLPPDSPSAPAHSAS